MKYFKYILNLPWTLIALILALISLPRSFNFKPDVLVVNARSFWWHPYKGVRGTTLGNVIILGRALEKNDLKHEQIHIEQHMREPLIHPILSFFEQLRHGPEHSKYEKEAYSKAGNLFKH